MVPRNAWHMVHDSSGELDKVSTCSILEKVRHEGGRNSENLNNQAVIYFAHFAEDYCPQCLFMLLCGRVAID